LRFSETRLRGAYVIDVEPHEDSRGFFARVWCRREFEDQGLVAELAQCSIAYNRRKGTLRGMHYQKAPHEEVKLVRCTKGAVYDVIIDLRPASESFRQWVGVELSEANHRTLYVPQGFAHGYITLKDDSELFYQMSEYYVPGAGAGVRWNDPAFNIEWPDVGDILIAERDQGWPLMEAAGGPL
jgi:dTDP-4-dehydrorhamnose 3,5-epimerase